MDATAEFVALVAGPEDRLPLDRGAILIAAHATPSLDVDAVIEVLDELAQSCPEATVEELRVHLFSTLGFRGNREFYDDPRNSLLDQVLERRIGIPITLGVVTLEVGRRLGLDLDGVGMPGHFLVGLGDGTYIDPFEAGKVLDAGGCRQQFHAVLGTEVPWDEAFLRPVGARAILSRILANLRQLYAAADALDQLVWVLRLRSSIPGVDRDERTQLADVLSALGRFDEAARALDDLAGVADHRQAEALRSRAVRLRARLN